MPTATAQTHVPATDGKENWVAEQEARLSKSIAADLRRLRQRHGSTLDKLSTHLGHEKNWLSKIERGVRSISASDYLLIMSRILESEPGHPAKALLDLYTRKSGCKPTVVKASPSR